MAEKKNLIPEEGPHGIDRWTSNGYGITLDGKEVEPPAEEDDNIDEIEETE